MSRQSGAEMIVKALEEECVPYTFGIPGAQNLELYDALDRSGSVLPVLVTDEQCASFMADGVSRSSDKLGCVNLVPGAGLTHALSGIAEAFMDQVPLLVLSCGVRSDIGKAFQLHDIPQLEVARPVTKAQYRVTNGGEITNALRDACRVARRPPRGPVIVEVPANLIVFRHEPAQHEGVEPRELPITTSSSDVAEIIAILKQARQPLLYLGNGCAETPQQDLIALSERLHAPVATSIQGKGVFPEDHPLWLWCGFGMAAPRFVRDIANSSDAMLAIGCRFSEVGTGSYGIKPPRPLLHVDIDPEVFNRNFIADVCVESNAASFVNLVLKDLKQRPKSSSLEETILRGHQEVRSRWKAQHCKDAVSGPALIAALQTCFGPDTKYVVDSGNGQFVAMECLRIARPKQFLAPVDFSCMGYALPAAIGAALANSGAQVVALIGDGAILMTGMELMTAAQLKVPIALFVLRDRELTQIAQFQDTAFAHRCASDLPNFELADLCAGLGVQFLKLEQDEDLEDGVSEARDRLRDGPCVVEVVFDNTQRTFFTQGVVQTNFSRLPWGERLRFIARAVGRRTIGAHW